MPYIKQEQREEIDRQLAAVVLAINTLPDPVDGAVNYAITKLLQHVRLSKGYARQVRVLGILEGVKLEFYRRDVAPYEDAKKVENGDVYPTVSAQERT